MGKVYSELKDMRHLEWSRIRHSSGTAGSFLKSEEMIGDTKWYYKLSSFDSVNGIFGHECINEIVVDRLLSFLDIPHLSYDLVHAMIVLNGCEKETYLCSSMNFRNRFESKISFENFYSLNQNPSESVLDFCTRMGWEKEVYDMLLTDFLILNRDRHGANVEILKENSDRSIRMAPLFDHGLSLLFSCHSDNDIHAFDVMEDKKIQSFVGGNSAVANISFIPKEKRRDLSQLSKLKKEQLAFLFEGLQEIVSPLWIDAVEEMIIGRAKLYESLRS